METPHNNDPFESFLNQGQPQDDFEKEAMDGFSQVSVEDLRLMKRNLDQRMEPLITPQKKRLPYLKIAASITFLVFLSVLSWYLIKPDNRPIARQTSGTPQFPQQVQVNEQPVQIHSDAIESSEARSHSLNSAGKARQDEDQKLPPPDHAIQTKEVVASARDVATENSHSMDQMGKSSSMEEKLEVKETMRMDSSVGKNKASARKMAAPMANAAMPAMAESDADVQTFSNLACVPSPEQQTLLKQLRAKLESEKIKGVFTVKIKINTQGHIEEVEILSSNLTSRDKKSVIDQIKRLTIASPINEPCIFVMNYQ